MKIAASEIWEDSDSVLIDVRTPAEYKQGHIPGAFNLPLFSNTERAVVGTLYKQKGPEKAMLQGLEIVGPKMKSLAEHAKTIADGRKVILHCWRGGKRSESMAWLFKMVGLNVDIIIGGYKAYRQLQTEFYSKNELNILVLGGRTGCGKTLLLHELAKQGQQIIDLEALAHHKGSAFGALGETVQESSEQFCNKLFDAFRKQDATKTYWIENESRAIGSVGIPEELWHKMKAAPLINIERSLDQRIEIIKAEYGHFSIEDLKQSFDKIRKKIGGQNLKKAHEALEGGNLAGAIKIALFYYDKAYQYYLDNNSTSIIKMLTINDLPIEKIAFELKELSVQVLKA